MESEFAIIGRALFFDCLPCFAAAGSIKEAGNSTKDLLLTGDLREFLEMLSEEMLQGALFVH